MEEASGGGGKWGREGEDKLGGTEVEGKGKKREGKRLERYIGPEKGRKRMSGYKRIWYKQF